MSEISVYDIVPTPKLADKLIGTSVGGVIEDVTYNFTLQELLQLFIPNIPANTLQGVLDYGNTATQNINLTGTINTTNLNVLATANILNSNLSGNTRVMAGLFDRTNSSGTAGQFLRSTGTQVEWFTIPTVIPTLQQVLQSGNTSNISIVLTANITAVTATAATVVSNTSLNVNGVLRDGTAAAGGSNQILSSTGSGVRWVDMPVYNVISPLLYDTPTKTFSIQVANSSQSGYLSSADWINFDGKQDAIILTTTGTSGPATFVANTLNIPVYTPDLSGYVPTSRTLTINGVTYDLSANRTWTLPVGVASVTATSPLFSSGGANPNITIQVASGGEDGYLSAVDWGTFNNKQNALDGGTGLVKSTAGTITYITDNSANWNTAYNDSIVSAAVTGTSTKTLTLNQQDGGTVTANWTDNGLTSVGVSMPSAFSVSNSPLTSNGTIAITGSGTALQYIDGTGALQTFPGLTGFVPYTGATTNVDLGTHNLTATSLIKLGGTSSQFLKADGSVDSTSYQPFITAGTTAQYYRGDKTFQTLDTTVVPEGTNLYYLDSRARAAFSASAPLSYNSTTGDFSISQSGASANGYLSSTDWNTFNNKQVAGDYITSLTGEATGTGPGATAVTLNNASVTGKVLTGVNITGGSVLATDTMLTAFGKLQNQINGLIGSTIYQGVWNANTNTPTLASGTGTRGYYYIVNVAGNTNLDGITDWQIGDWAIYDGSAWQKVDNTDAVTSVNGFTGAVSLTTDNIAEGTTNLYFSNARARSAVSLTTTGSSGAATYNNTTGVFNIPNYGTALADYLPLTGGTLTGGLVINPANTGVIGLDVASDTVRLRSDSTNPFPRQLTTTMGSGTLVKIQAAGYGAVYVTDLGFYTSSSSAVNTTPNLYLTGGDNRVGINTITPAYTLDVVGTVGVSGVLTLGSTISNGTFTYTLPGATGTLALTSQIPSVTGFVPYTGATANVDLGTHTLIAAKGTFSSSGSADTVSITHSSGSGIALNITKGGSGEGIYVNKTSGSGNAVTIVGTLNATTLVKSGGTSAQFLKADGSVDSTAYGTGTVTSVAALTLGTTGTDLSSSVATGTTTPVITLNVPTASATNRGALSAADWTTFNSKQNALTNPITGTGTTNRIPKFTGASTLGNSIITEGTGFITVSGAAVDNYVASFINTDAGSAGIYVKADGPAFVCEPLSLVGGITLNASGSASFSGDITANKYIKAGGTSSQFLMADGSVSSGPSGGITGSLTTNYIPKATSATTIGNSQIFDNGTNVGIGTITPAVKLDIVDSTTTSSTLNVSNTSTANANIRLYGSNQTTYFLDVASGNNSHWIWGSGAVPILFATSATERMRIDASGNLLFNPNGNASKYININQGTASDGGFLFNRAGANKWQQNIISSDADAMSFYSYTSVSVVMQLRSNGNVLIGTQTDGGFKLDVNGTGRFKAPLTIDANSNSDWATGINNLGTTSANGLYVNIGAASTGKPFAVYKNFSQLFGVENSGAATFSSSVTATNNVTISSTSNASLVAATNSTTGFTFIDLINNGASGKNYQIGIAGNAAVAGYANNLYIDLVGSGNIITLTSGRNVLIGTQTDAGFKLDVNGTGRFSGALTGTSGAFSSSLSLTRNSNSGTSISITNTDGGSSAIAEYVLNTNSSGFASLGKNSSTRDGAGIIDPSDTFLYSEGGGSISVFNNFSSGQIRFAAGGSTSAHFTIASTGAATFSSSVTANGVIRSNAGIFQIFAADVFRGGLYNYASTIGSGTDYSPSLNSETNLYFTTGGSGTQKMTILSGGNVGIGTVSPTAKLNVEVGSNTDGIFLSRTGANKQAILILADTANGASISGGTNPNGTATQGDGFGRLILQNGPSEGFIFQTSAVAAGAAQSWNTRMAIKNNGNVVIGNGTTDAGGRLQVNGGDIRMNPANAAANYYITINKRSGQDGGILWQRDNGNDWQFVNDNATGNFLFYSYGAANTTLTFTRSNSNATFISSVTATSFFESSDATIKTLIQDNYQIKGIESVTAKLYTKNGKEELGYFAQDVQGILPSAVSKGTDGLLSLSYREVHTAKIARLEKRVEELEKQLKLN
jgi:hypothetical protein